MAKTHPRVFSIPKELSPFLDSLPNKSAFVARLILDSGQYQAWEETRWKEGQA